MPQLLAHFDKTCDAPDAVPSLRRFILDLGVRGRLVEQDSEDKPALELLKLLGGAFAQSPSAPPSGWVTETIGKLLEFKYGKGLSAGDRHERGSVPVYGSNGVVGYTGESLADQPALIIGRKGSAGALNICMGHSWTTDVAYYCIPPPFFDIHFLLLSLRTLDLDKLGKGVKPGLSREDAYKLRIVVPPLTEQRRIVAKADELTALCDRLEAAQVERESRRDRLVAASLHRLTRSADADAQAFREHARFNFDNFSRLTARPDHVEQLRQSIIAIAVRGYLVPQDAGDEPASRLLLRIRERRAKLLEQGYPNRSEASTQMRKQEQQVLPGHLARLPSGWHWATLIQCSALVVDCHNKTAPYSKAGVILLRTTNVRQGRVNLNEPRFVDEQTYAHWSARCQPHAGDVLITREAPMGEACIIPQGMRVCLGQRMMLARLVPDTIDPRFMLYSLRDPHLMDRVQDKPVGATVKHLRVGGVETLLVPVPPLGEQHRIVAKLDELMALCDGLEAQITTAQDGSRRLLEAALHEALSGAQVPVGTSG